MSYRPRFHRPSEFWRSVQNWLKLSPGDGITSMLRKINLRQRWLNILLLLLMVLFIIFANLSAEIPRPTANTVTLDATIYLPTETLKPILQSNVDQQSSNQGWPTSLIHPSVTQLTPQSDGLAMTLSQSLFPGGPSPIDSSTLLKFGVLNSSTIQVSGEPMAGGPAFLNGPLTQIKVTQGSVNSISPTPNCGDSALAVKLGFPISIGQAQQGSQAKLIQSAEMIRQPSANTATAKAYVEVTSSVLASLGNQIGSFPVSQNLTAQNIRISIENNEILVRSDISLWQTGIMVGSTTIHILPLVENGNLLLHVTETDISVAFLTFLDDSYNQQIQNQINLQLANALGGLFTVTKVGISSDMHIPCTARDSLILTGTTNMLS